MSFSLYMYEIKILWTVVADFSKWQKLFDFEEMKLCHIFFISNTTWFEFCLISNSQIRQSGESSRDSARRACRRQARSIDRNRCPRRRRRPTASGPDARRPWDHRHHPCRHPCPPRRRRRWSPDEAWSWVLAASASSAAHTHGCWRQVGSPLSTR